MKVLYITNVPSPYRVDFFNELSQYCDLTVAYEKRKSSDRDIQWKNKNKRAYIEIFLTGIAVREDAAVCLGVIKLLKMQWDIIVISGYATPTGMVAITYLSAIGKKFGISADGGMIKNDNGIKYKIKRWFISKASWWLSTGKVTTEYLGYYGAQTSRVFEYPFASVRESDIGKVDVKKNDLRKDLGISEKLVVISVGQFVERKGFDILIKSCSLLRGDIGVYIIGGRPTEQYNKIIEELKLENINFIGFKTQEELKKYYLAADLFVLPTREDIWGLVVNEAMAFGLPVITTNKCVAGLSMITDGKNGWIIPVEEHAVLADKINVFFRNEDKIQEMNSEAIETAKEYSIEKMALKHIEIFRMLLQEN
ncbi:glycosyltransferase family 4 protein [Aminipila terrae]|uniref:Glycosyltransferase n=1 Tax=Aminipila terrae TaxID=2697030 RepID=A0A6P1MBS7_9FIRM|nr:glycosyltransferase family 4 protein [Aminipila terrae]QHI72090.1 glycosyltransferase [Aminipila terrae]